MEAARANAPAHRLDEFPAGYSSGLISSIARLRFTSRARVCCNLVLPVEIFFIERPIVSYLFMSAEGASAKQYKNTKSQLSA